MRSSKVIYDRGGGLSSGKGVVDNAFLSEPVLDLQLADTILDNAFDALVLVPSMVYVVYKALLSSRP